MATFSEVEQVCGTKEHHTAYCKGYVPVNTKIIKEYSGKFGVGFTVKTSNKNSTRYCFITYYIKKADEVVV